MTAVKSFIVQASLFKAAFSRLRPVFDKLLATLEITSFAALPTSTSRTSELKTRFRANERKFTFDGGPGHSVIKLLTAVIYDCP
jgi:hypothetical protein